MGSPIVADLLSDTLTKPTEGMRQAMAGAEVGDDVFGEDPTVRELEERVAALLGHEAGLYSPTGSLANQLGMRLHVAPGEEIIADSLAHVVRAELGAAAVFSGITSRTWASAVGHIKSAPRVWSSRTRTTSAGAWSSLWRRCRSSRRAPAPRG